MALLLQHVLKTDLDQDRWSVFKTAHLAGLDDNLLAGSSST